MFYVVDLFCGLVDGVFRFGLLLLINMGGGWGGWDWGGGGGVGGLVNFMELGGFWGICNDMFGCVGLGLFCCIVGIWFEVEVCFLGFMEVYCVIVGVGVVVLFDDMFWFGGKEFRGVLDFVVCWFDGYVVEEKFWLLIGVWFIGGFFFVLLFDLGFVFYVEDIFFIFCFWFGLSLEGVMVEWGLFGLF